jgi:hypothetical protein
VPGEPPLGFGFRDDREDLDGFGSDIIENSHLPDPEPALGPAHAAQTLNSTSARPSRMVAQMPFESVPHLGPPVGRQGSIGLHRFGREDELKSHLAR